MLVQEMNPVWRVDALMWLQTLLAAQRQLSSRGDLQCRDVLIAVSMQINKEGMQIHIIDDAQV